MLFERFIRFPAIFTFLAIHSDFGTLESFQNKKTNHSGHEVSDYEKSGGSCGLELEPLVVPADSGTLKFPLVGWDFSEL